jgi:hypothetical protein
VAYPVQPIAEGDALGNHPGLRSGIQPSVLDEQ